VKRREFITLLGSAAAVWPLAARAQQTERVRRIGILMNTDTADSEAQSHVLVFRQALQELGWSEGRNVTFDTRWSAGSTARIRQHAEELMAFAPDVVLARGAAVGLQLQAASRTVPIVVAQAIDPVGSGIVARLARPGGNVTGFLQFEYSLSGKWPQLLKEIAPKVTRAAIVRDPGTPAGIGQWAVIQAVADVVGMEMVPVSARDTDALVRELDEFAQVPGGGMIVPVSANAVIRRHLIIAQAARHGLPAVYPYRHFVDAGGLISYGPDLAVQYRLAAGYADRILKGEKPADLPVQAPTKYELVINLKTTTTLGLEVPPTLLARADEVIE
jgi:putative ABC transport system substrate-binding protein